MRTSENYAHTSQKPVHRYAISTRIVGESVHLLLSRVCTLPPGVRVLEWSVHILSSGVHILSSGVHMLSRSVRAPLR